MLSNYPLLNKAIKDGKIFIRCQEYIGIASDGVEVQVGSIGFEGQTEAYLRAYPTPDKW